MRIVLIMVALLGALVLAVLAIGWATPERHEVSASADFQLPPEGLHAVLTDFAAYPTWRSGLTSVAVSQDGLRIVEQGSDGSLPYRVIESIAGQRLVTEIDDPSLPFGGTWTFELEPQGTGTRLTITERGVVHNILFRFFSRFMAQDAGIRRFLADLQRRVG